MRSIKENVISEVEFSDYSMKKMNKNRFELIAFVAIRQK